MRARERSGDCVVVCASYGGFATLPNHTNLSPHVSKKVDAGQ